MRFLTAVWGARYIREFAAISLPSFLAPGNLPALAGTSDLDVVILTTAESIPEFDRHPAFRRLREITDVRFILIDDLVTFGIYGVTLTLAYARGIMDAGTDQTKTWFVFMNSDFVLADGSLKSLAYRLGDAPGAIMSSSLRGQAEALLPKLEDRVTNGGTELSLLARDGVRLALDHPHQTVLAKCVTQSSLQSTSYNHVYWRVDRDTLLARNFLIFMLAIKPAVPMPPVSSYCDYGFVPSLVPDSPISVIGDSDDFFMLELQPSEQEREMVQLGKTTPKKIARELSVWTTAEHRFCATQDVVFHAADLPPPSVLDDARQKLDAEIKRIFIFLKKPKDDRFHRYWVQGVAIWQQFRTESSMDGSDPELPPELDVSFPQSAGKRLAVFAIAASQKIFPHWKTSGDGSGIWRASSTWRAPRPPYPIWTAMYRGRALLDFWANMHQGDRTCVLWSRKDITDGTTRPWANLFSARVGADNCTWQDLSTDKLHAYDSCIAVCTTRSLGETAEHISRILSDEGWSGEIALFVDNVRGEHEMVNVTRQAFGTLIEKDSALLLQHDILADAAGTFWDMRLSRIQRHLARVLVLSGPLTILASPVRLIAGVAATVAIVATNLLAGGRRNNGQSGGVALLLRFPATQKPGVIDIQQGL